MESKIFAVYKPKGPTSNDIVQKIKKITGAKKVGHAGTLDPLAKGILVIGVGREATKKLNSVVQKEKEYLATIRFGATSPTDDAEGPINGHSMSINSISIIKIRKAVKKFTGKIKQTPPPYSAVKINGEEAYKLARGGKFDQLAKHLKPRAVEIKKIKIISYHWPYLKLQVTTGPGVYIRSLARDIGKALDVGGYLYNLERIRVGEFTKQKTLTLKAIKQLKNVS